MRPARAIAPAAVAIVHDAFTQRGGAELVAARLASLFPEAPVFAGVMDPSALPRGIGVDRVTTTMLQPLYAAGLPLRAVAPALPFAFGRLDVGAPDVLVSSTSSFAHHVRPARSTVHIAYVHAPPRFAWQPDEYFRAAGTERRLFGLGLAAVRRLDRRAAGGVDIFVANSRRTADRIASAYGRTSIVVPPPIDVDRFAPSTERTGRFLVVARLRRHKAIDRAIEAADRLGVPLDIVGEGPDDARLRRLAGPTVRVRGRLTDPEVAWLMARCVGLIVPAAEDFGMTIAEVQAAGRPPIACAAGGALDIISDGTTGFLVPDESVDALVGAMDRARTISVATEDLVRSARRFAAAHFDAAILALVADARDRSGAALRRAS